MTPSPLTGQVLPDRQIPLEMLMKRGLFSFVDPWWKRVNEGEKASFCQDPSIGLIEIGTKFSGSNKNVFSRGRFIVNSR